MAAELKHELVAILRSSGDFRAIQDLVVRRLQSAFGLSRVNILLYNKPANMLETVSSVGHIQADYREIRTPVVRVPGISSRASQVRSYLDKKTIVVTDRSGDPEYQARARFPHKVYAREFAIFPLVAGARRLGVLSIAVDEANSTHLTPSLVRTIKGLCPVLARAIYATMPRLPTDKRMVGVLKDILARRLIYPLYQPIVDLEQRTVFAYEALLRADHPLLAGPIVLLGYAEKFNALRDVSQVIHEAALEVVPRLGVRQKLFLNLNIGDFREYLRLERPANPFHGHDPRRFVLEITERQYADDIVQLRRHFADFRRLGFGVAIDDLGSGYSSLNLLPSLEPDWIKLDISLVRGIASNKRQRELVRSLLAFARRTDTRCICEGVETREDLKVLISLGARYVQGFVLARPAAELLSTADLRRRLNLLL